MLRHFLTLFAVLTAGDLLSAEPVKTETPAPTASWSSDFLMAKCLDWDDRMDDKEAIPMLREMIPVVEKRMAGNSRLLRKTWRRLGLALMDTGKPQEAREALKKLVELSQDGTESELNLDRGLLGEALQRCGQITEAEELFQKGLPGLRKDGMTSREDLIAVLQRLVKLPNKVGETFDVSELRTELDLQISLSAKDNTSQFTSSANHATLRDLNHQSVKLNAEGKYEEALKAAEDCLKLYREANQIDTPEAATTEINRGVALMNLRRWAEAEASFQKSIPLLEKGGPPFEDSLLLTRSHLAMAISRVAEIQGDDKRKQQAMDIEREVLSSMEKKYGANDLKLAIRLNNLAISVSDAGNHKEAEKLIRRAIQIEEGQINPKDKQYARTRLNLVSILIQKGSYTDAEEAAWKLLDEVQTALGAEHPSLMEILGLYAKILSLLNLPEDAHAAFEQALVIGEKAHGPDHLELAPLNERLAILELKKRNLQKALKFLEKALAIRRVHFKESKIRILDDLATLAALLERDNQEEPVVAVRQEIVDCMEKLEGKEHPELIYPLIQLSKALEKLPMDKRTDVPAQRALAISRKSFGENHPSTASAVFILGRMEARQKKTLEAEAHLRAGLLGLVHSKDDMTPISDALFVYAGVLQELKLSSGQIATRIDKIKEGINPGEITANRS